MLDDRFWSKVEKTDSCWNWTATKTKDGYGKFKLNGKMEMAYRVSYVDVKGDIPQGLQIDHLCQNPSCVNPSHLEAVTPRENVLRGIGIPSQNARKTHCKRGHEFTENNTYIYPNGSRMCRKCQKIHHYNDYHKNIKKSRNYYRTRHQIQKMRILLA